MNDIDAGHETAASTSTSAAATATAERLLAAGRELFASGGYERASVRAITERAGANLGAITYHFGSKEALYEAVVGECAGPLREAVARAAAGPGGALDRICAVTREFFAHLARHPDVPRLMLQQLANGGAIPRAAVEMIRRNREAITGLIRQGQRDGSIRAGDPTFMALGVVSQPIYVALTARVLREAGVLDPEDGDARARVVVEAIRFVRAGLARGREVGA